jgi:hypothetical protein
MFDRLFDATKAQYIARPESAATQLVHRHADTTIPRGAKLTVRACAASRSICCGRKSFEKGCCARSDWKCCAVLREHCSAKTHLLV